MGVLLLVIRLFHIQTLATNLLNVKTATAWFMSALMGCIGIPILDFATLRKM